MKIKDGIIQINSDLERNYKISEILRKWKEHLEGGGSGVPLHRQIQSYERCLEEVFNKFQEINNNLNKELEERTREMRASEERFSLAMRGSNAGLWEWNLETDEVYFSQHWKRMLGYAEDELDETLETWASLVHPDDKKSVLERGRDYVKGRAASFEVEMRMRHKNGSELFVLSRAFLVRGEPDIGPARMIGANIDITKQKNAELHIKRTSEIFEMIAKGEYASSIYDAIALLYEPRNPGTRCSMMELKGDKLMYVGGPSLPKEFCEAINGLQIGPNVGSCGTTTYTGKRIFVENIETDPKWEKIKHIAVPHGMRCCWSEPIKDSFGEVLGAFGMYRDYPALPNDRELLDLESAARLAGIVMERERREASLRKLSEAIKHAGEAVMVTDSSGLIEYVNPSFTTMTGYSTEDVLGKNAKILNSGAQTKEFYDNLWATISGGATWKSTIIDRRKDGSEFPSLISISPIFSGDRITHYVGIQQDMTEKEAAEEKFRQAQKMEALGTLVGGIAHDFNNLLAGIKGTLYLAQLDAQNFPSVSEKLFDIEALSDRAAKLIQQLLTFARKDRVHMEPIELSSLVDEVYTILRSSTPENIELRLDFERSIPLQIRGDSTQLHQILLNLVNNARDALEGIENPVITIKLEPFYADKSFAASHPYFEIGYYIHLSVEDNGSGIAEENLQHLFEPFFTTKDVGKGTGLGLAMVFGAIERHHGHVEVHSDEGKGTTFSMYFQMLSNKEVAIPLKQKDELPIKGIDEITVLFVDDELGVLKLGIEVLESMGYRVFGASNGKEAIDVFTNHQGEISLVITDVVMPQLGGIQAVEAIREIRPDIKVIFTTGYDDSSLMEIGGNEVVLRKPYSTGVLSQAIHNVLEK